MSDYSSLKTIRDHSQKVYEHVQSGQGNFELTLNWETFTKDLKTFIEGRYPKKVPPHSRWRHISPPSKKLNNQIDYLFVSVLMDAGANAEWAFEHKQKNYHRSEALAWASDELCKKFPPTGKNLRSLTEKDFINIFQISESNPLLGANQRLKTLHKLGELLKAVPNDAPHGLFQDITPQWNCSQIFQVLVKFLAPLFGEQENSPHPGDLGYYPPLDLWVPFHKLIQWLSYSLVESFREHQFPCPGENELTALAEYRNGGLFIDSGVLKLKNPAKKYYPTDPVIVEWRALTIVLMDQLKKHFPQYTLAQLMEGGTWAYGRKLAKIRNGSTPPLNLISSGTLF